MVRAETREEKGDRRCTAWAETREEKGDRRCTAWAETREEKGDTRCAASVETREEKGDIRCAARQAQEMGIIVMYRCSFTHVKSPEIYRDKLNGHIKIIARAANSFSFPVSNL